MIEMKIKALVIGMLILPAAELLASDAFVVRFDTSRSPHHAAGWCTGMSCSSTTAWPLIAIATVCARSVCQQRAFSASQETWRQTEAEYRQILELPKDELSILAYSVEKGRQRISLSPGIPSVQHLLVRGYLMEAGRTQNPELYSYRV